MAVKTGRALAAFAAIGMLAACAGQQNAEQASSTEVATQLSARSGAAASASAQPQAQSARRSPIARAAVDDDSRFGCLDAGCREIARPGWSAGPEEIAEAKALLQELGYGPFSQGVQAGPTMRAALSDFQFKAGLPAGGSQSLDTLELLRVVADFRVAAAASGSDASLGMINGITARGRAAFERGEYAQAQSEFETAFFLLSRISLAPGRPPTPERRVELAQIGGELAWYSVFARSYVDAERYARAAIDLAPNQTWIRGNLAYALMFQDRATDALAIHNAERDSKLFSSQVPWATAVRGDFRLLRAAGLEHPQMGAILTALGASAEDPPS